MDSIEYDLDFLQPPKARYVPPPPAMPPPVASVTDTPSNVMPTLASRTSIPSFDRSTKPKQNGSLMNNAADGSTLVEHRTVGLDKISNQLADSTPLPAGISKMLPMSISSAKGVLGKNTNITNPTNTTLPSGVPGKITNIPAAGQSTPKPTIPLLDRSTKPAFHFGSGSLSLGSSQEEETDAESPSSESDRGDLADLKRHNTALVLENKARIAKLEKDKLEVKALQKLKNKEAGELANLMRQKKLISEEIKALRHQQMMLEQSELTNRYICYGVPNLITDILFSHHSAIKVPFARNYCN